METLEWRSSSRLSGSAKETRRPRDRVRPAHVLRGLVLFNNQPEKARAFLKAGAEANPWSFEIQSSLGKLYFDYFKEYRLAAAALARSVDLVKKEKVYLSKHDDRFDEQQKQTIGETYLYLARSYSELHEYDKGLATCDSGMKEAPAYNLLRVEKRIINKRMATDTSSHSPKKAGS